MSILEVREGLQKQTSTEIIVYSITTTNWVSLPTSPVVVVYDEETETDVTSTVMPVNSPSPASDTITLSPLKSLTKGRIYRIEVAFVVGASTYECYFRVQCER
jgi:hypothetical protein